MKYLLKQVFKHFIKAPFLNIWEKFQAPKPLPPKSEWGDFDMDEYDTLRLNLESENVQKNMREHFKQVKAYHEALKLERAAQSKEAEQVN